MGPPHLPEAKTSSNCKDKPDHQSNNTFLEIKNPQTNGPVEKPDGSSRQNQTCQNSASGCKPFSQIYPIWVKTEAHNLIHGDSLPPAITATLF